MNRRVVEPGWEQWKWWRPHHVHRQGNRTRFIYDDGCYGACFPFVLPGICGLCLSLGIIFSLIAFATPYWVLYESGTEGKASYRELYFGLWTSCAIGGQQDVSCDEIIDNDLPDWMVTVMALSTVALGLSAASLIGILAWLCRRKRLILIKICLVILLVITLCLMISVEVLFNFKADDYVKDILKSNNLPEADYIFSWSFYIYAVACGFTALCPSLLICIPAYGTHLPPDYGRKHMNFTQPSDTPTMHRPSSYYRGQPYRGPIMPPVLPHRAASHAGYPTRPLQYDSTLGTYPTFPARPVFSRSIPEQSRSYNYY